MSARLTIVGGVGKHRQSLPTDKAGVGQLRKGSVIAIIIKYRQWLKEPAGFKKFSAGKAIIKEYALASLPTPAIS